MKIKYIISVILILWVNLSFNCAFAEDNLIYTNQESLNQAAKEEILSSVTTLYNNFKKDLLSKVNKNEYLLIKDVSLEIIADPNPLYILSDKQAKEIVISDGFVYTLLTYINCFLLDSYVFANRVPQPEDVFSDAYFRYWNFSSLYRNNPPKDYLTYSKITKEEKENFTTNKTIQQVRLSLMEAALTFIFAHEFGHFATNSFYNINNANKKTVYDIENKVDLWAFQKTNEMKGNAFVGLMSFFYLYSMDKYNIMLPTKLRSYHPPTLERIQNIYNYFQKSYSQNYVYTYFKIYDPPKAVQLMKNFNDIMTNFGILIDYYEKQSKSAYWYSKYKSSHRPLYGYIYAHMKMYNEDEGIDNQAAFSMIEELSKNGYSPATALLGYFYENGVVVKQDLEKAFDCYKIGNDNNASYGVARYNGWLRGIKAKPKVISQTR